MSTQLRTASHEEIGKWVRDAATAKPWRPGHNLRDGPALAPQHRDHHLALVAAALNRARVKTYVRLVKPFRRLFRNQGAVNNGLIEAVYHLSRQTQEMMQEINHLRRTVASLRKQLEAASATTNDMPGPEMSVGRSRHNPDPPSSCE
ncbi:MAG TPA: hypothetical protein VF683_03185 [Chthoniobacterales bacterium]